MNKQVAFIYDFKQGTAVDDSGTSFPWYQLFGFRPATKTEVELHLANPGSLIPFSRDADGRASTKIKIRRQLRQNFPKFDNLPGWYLLESEMIGSENLIVSATEIQPVKIPDISQIK